jgi:hypothetical protein
LAITDFVAVSKALAVGTFVEACAASGVTNDEATVHKAMESRTRR